ncbi:MAG: autotransporter outer membrane beta-barrel domain-containing protein [Bilophila wadsworthia]
MFSLALRRTFDQPGRSGMGGYDATNVGLIRCGTEHARADCRRACRVNHQSMTGDANGKLRGEGLYLGAQGLYAPAGWDGWNVFGIGRLGVENWRMKRAVSFNGYNRENNKDWTGFSGSVRAGGGYEADWGTIKAGPFAALDYAFSSRPSLTEDNGMGSRLHLDSETFHSLRSSLGVRMSTNERQLGEHATWKAHVSRGTTTVRQAGTMHIIRGSGQRGLLQHWKVPGRDSLGLGAGVFQHGQARLFLLKRRERTFPP